MKDDKEYQEAVKKFLEDGGTIQQIPPGPEMSWQYKIDKVNKRKVNEKEEV